MELRPVMKVMLPILQPCVTSVVHRVQTSGYTQFNIAALILWYALECPSTLGSILWCNSCGIVFSYEMIRVVGKESLYSLKQQIIPYSDVILHITPFLALRYVPASRPIHALISIATHTLWGMAHDFDLNKVYALNPALSLAAMRFLWACSIVGHVASTWLCRDTIAVAVQCIWPFTHLR